MYVFRDGRSEVSTRLLQSELERQLEAIRAGAGPVEIDRTIVDALIRAGELECGLADAASPDGSRAARVTDLLARCLLQTVAPRAAAADALSILDSRLGPEVLRVSAPEGFVYYALHPLDFADLASRMTVTAPRVCVVGVRTIGTTLSAVVAAALEKRGVTAARATIRPYGHPFDRTVTFGTAERRWLGDELAKGARAMVVDEGPGMSGASFLATAEALVSLGFRDHDITLLCSRRIDPSRLVARDAAARWSRFAADAVSPNGRIPRDAGPWVGGGSWRSHVYADENDWPACWPMTERAKFLSRDRGRMLKFEGLGRHGAQVFARAEALARAGFAPAVENAGDGYFAYEAIQGRPLTPADASPSVLARIADYCAARGSMFSAALADGRELATMLDTNFSRLELDGAPLPGRAPELAIERPVVADARMLPHEWLALPDRLMKIDAVTHGDDHFFPGPVDIAWDLAGTIVEWELTPAAREFLLSAYGRASGDRADRRIGPYVLAYAIFRLAFTKMAAANLEDARERARMRAAEGRYRAVLRRELEAQQAARSEP